MREVTYFIADDGTKFDDANDCRNYELKCSISEVADGLILLDYNFHPLKITDYDESMYVIIRDKKAIEPLKNFCKEWGYCSPWDYEGNDDEKCGIYVFDCDEDEMYNLEDRINELTEMKANVEFALGNEFGFESLYKKFKF